MGCVVVLLLSCWIFSIVLCSACAFLVENKADKQQDVDEEKNYLDVDRG